jgi:DNA repair exonuclease SbcCD nuclease subunit
MIVFMGDWFENRNAINVATLNSSFMGLKRLNALNIPIRFCIGNHDLYHRESRKEFSTLHFENFENVDLISEIKVLKDMAFIPYLFKGEYPDVAAFLDNKKIKYAFGHFEFKNFVITGTDRVMEHGPDHKAFSRQKYIFSGHFHKRQIQDNVVYIGNTFPTNFGDAWDDDRGMCVLDTETDKIKFINWTDCPKYRKVKLSSLLAEESSSLPKKSRVKCVVDVEISYSEAQQVKEELIDRLNLREFSFEETNVERAGDQDEDSIDDFEIASLNDAIVKMIETGVPTTVNIDPKILAEIYSKL